MRSLPIVLSTFFGVAAFAACGPAADSSAEAAENPETAAASEVAQSQDQGPSCFMAQGTPAEAAQRPSPLGQTAIVVGGMEGLVCYGRPYVKGRTIFGEMHGFGETWRMGANEATALHLTFDATVGGIELPAGSYSLYAVPGESEWEIFLNENVERWGVPINDEVTAANIGSFTVPSSETDDLVEQLTFTWQPQGTNSGNLVMEWENTRVEIPVAKSGM
jgi:hypothetical protein